MTVTVNGNGTISGLTAGGIPAGSQPIATGTAVNLSGASVDFTGIPSWAKKIIILVASLSTTGTSNPLFQIGDSGGIEATGYLGAGSTVTGATPSSALFTTGFGLNLGAATNIIHGRLELLLLNPLTNLWVADGLFARSDAASNQMTAGSKALSAVLDRIRITTVGGTDTFDSGSANIFYEG